MDSKWLLFCPQLPATPSSPRVAVWRRMHAAGSVGLDNGLWVLPNTPQAVAFIEEMKAYVETQGGISKIFSANALDDQTENGILEVFLNDRAEEYAELKEQCDDFLKELEKETGRENFSFAELEENEQDLAKLKTWFEKVRARDFIGGRQASEAETWLEKCQEAFQTFATEVFNHENKDHAQKMKFDPGVWNEFKPGGETK